MQLLAALRKSGLLFLHQARIMQLKLKGAEIGKNTWVLVDIIKQGGIMPCKLKIGNSCVLCANTLFLCGDGFRHLLKRHSGNKSDFDGITIMDNCFIGIGAIILNGVTIGPNAIVGAGAVVMEDVKPNTCVAGNPDRFVCSLTSYAKVAEESLIDGYSKIAGRHAEKSEFLTNFFWGKS